jgi:hypothetical protein
MRDPSLVVGYVTERRTDASRLCSVIGCDTTPERTLKKLLKNDPLSIAC